MIKVIAFGHLKRTKCLAAVALQFCFLTSAVMAQNDSNMLLAPKSLKGTLTHNGTSMSGLTSVEPSFIIRDAETGQSYEQAIASYNANNGKYTIDGLDDTIPVSIAVSFHLFGGRETLPGNYFHHSNAVDISSLTPSQQNNYDLAMLQVMHLREPFDNNNVFDASGEISTYLAPISFTWDEVNGADSYQVRINRVRDRDHPAGYGLIEQVQLTNASEPTYSSLLRKSAPQEHYEFELTALASRQQIGKYVTTLANSSQANYPFKIEAPEQPPVQPAPPENLASDVKDNNVILSWDASSENDVIRYRIYGGITPNPSTRIDSVEGRGSTTAVLEDIDLSANTYYFRVTAVTSSWLESDFSNEVSVMQQQPMPPPPPTNLAGDVSDGNVALNWVASNDPGVIRYRIYGGITPNPSTRIDSVEGRTSTTAVLQDVDLSANTYYFRVRAVTSSLLESDFSNEVSIMQQSPVKPAPPTNLAGEVNDGNVTLHWVASNDPEIIRYCIYGGITANPTTQIDSVEGRTSTNIVIQELDLSANTYYFRINAIASSLLESNFSNEISIMQQPNTRKSLQGSLNYNGVKMSTLTNVEPSFIIVDEATGQPYQQAIASYNANNGNYTIDNLDDTVTVSITTSFHLVGELPTLPGNYYNITGPIPIAALTSSQRNSFDLSMWKIIHLLEPFDNASPGDISDETLVYMAPLSFGWEAIDEADTYQVRITRVRDEDHPAGYGFIEQELLVDVSEPTYTSSLNENTGQEHYEFEVTAFAAGEPVGNYLTTHSTGSRPNLPFKVSAENQPPFAPRNLNGYFDGAQITLSWTANSEPDVIQYRVYGDTTQAATALIATVDGKANTSLVVKNLNLNTNAYYFRVTAVDSFLLESAFSSEVSFGPVTGNSPPAARFTPKDTTIALLSPTLRIDLTSPVLFSDPDGDPLSFRAESSAPVVSATVNGNVLTLAPLSIGSAIITVYADDNRGPSATANFSVNVISSASLVSILHTKPQRVAFAEPLTIRANITNWVNGLSATVYYRPGGSDVFLPIQMQRQEDECVATIPNFAVNSRGIEYYIEVSDAAQAKKNPDLNYYSLQVQIPAGRLSSPLFKGGDSQTAYQIFSIPYDLEDKNPISILSDLGEYNKRDWRFYEVGENGRKMEFPNIDPISPGKAYWIISRSSGRSISIGSGLTNLTGSPYEIPLQTGWNLIGNPFDFIIPVGNLRLANGEDFILRSYSGSWNDFGVNPITQIQPFQGYALYSASNEPTALLIEPGAQTDTAQLTKGSRQPDLFDERMQWHLRVSAKCQRALDNDTYLGVLKDEVSPVNLTEPPGIGEYVSVYFNRAGQKFCTDFRRSSREGHTWQIEIESNIRDVVELAFQSITELPAKMAVMLYDPQVGTAQNLRHNDHYMLSASSTSRKLSIMVGTAEFIEDQVEGLVTTPSSFELSQNFPNPFNPSTSIKFGLPQAANVTLSIYNVGGQLVDRLLADKWMEAGFHAVVWNGRDSYGTPVGSGLFFYQLRTAKQAITKRMLLVR